MDKDKIFEEYEKEMQEDLFLDEMNAKEKSMRLGITKQKWANRISKHKIKLRDLQQEKADKVDSALGNLPIKVSVASRNKAAEFQPDIKILNKQIRDQEDIIEYLEMAYKNLESLGWNMKNLIELIKMENY